jgi:hypothetical protein
VIGTFFAAQPIQVLEFGTWHGSSTLTWLKVCPQAHIVCVDTWLGSWEHWLNTDPGSHFSKDMLRVQDGRTFFFEDFLSNVVLSGLEERTTPIQNTTANAYELLSRQKMFFDLIYIDAAHDFESVLLDVEMASRLLKPDGVLCGDDFDTWDSVRKAVESWCQIESRTLYYGQNGWVVVPKSSKLNPLIRELEQEGFKKASLHTTTQVLSTLGSSPNFETTTALLMSSKGSSPNSLRRLVRQFLLTNYWVIQKNDQYSRKFPNLMRKLRELVSSFIA